MTFSAIRVIVYPIARNLDHFGMLVNRELVMQPIPPAGDVLAALGCRYWDKALCGRYRDAAFMGFAVRAGGARAVERLKTKLVLRSYSLRS